VMQLAEQPHDLESRRRVEVARRFVGEEDAGVVHERAGDRHALALSSRQLVGPVVHPVAQPDPFERLCGARAPFLGAEAGVNEGQLHVVQRVGAGQEIERLKYEPDLLVADPRQVVVGEIAHLLRVQPVLAARGRVEAADQVHQRRLAGPRRAHDRHVLVLADLDADAAQGPHRLGAHVVLTRQLVRQDHDVGERRIPGAELLLAHDGLRPAESDAWRVAFTRDPSFRSRMAWYGPATMLSPSRTPSITSKYSSPAIPTFTGRNVATPLFTMNTPSVSFFLGSAAAGAPAAGAGALLAVPPRSSLATGVFSRTVSAMMGIARLCLRVSVTIRAVADRSGRTSA